MNSKIYFTLMAAQALILIIPTGKSNAQSVPDSILNPEGEEKMMDMNHKGEPSQLFFIDAPEDDGPVQVRSRFRQRRE